MSVDSAEGKTTRSISTKFTKTYLVGQIDAGEGFMKMFENPSPF